MARGEVTADLLIPDNVPAGVQSTMMIDEPGSATSLSVRVSIMHTYIGDLQVELVAPSGKRALLHDRTGGSTHDLKQTLTSASLPALAALAGQSIQGAWALAVRDLAKRDTGRINWWGLEIEYAPLDQTVTGTAQPDLAIPDADPQGVRSTIAIVPAGTAKGIEVRVEIAHTYRGDLLVDLVAPSGRTATLHSRTGGSQDDVRATYDATSAPALAGLVGEPIQGDWKLHVRDLQRVDIGRLERWSLTVRY